MYSIIIRLIDIVISLTAIISLSPLLLLVGGAVMFDLGNPIIFKQIRLGLKGQRFKIYKFRSMRDEVLDIKKYERVNDYTIKVKSDPRITRLGKFLRSTSLDELPQLFNVLIGDMSIVGPRPFVPDEYSNFQKRWVERLNVKPGITGLAQIRGRSDLTMEEIIESDVEWIENKGILLYFNVLIKTFYYVVKRNNVY